MGSSRAPRQNPLWVGWPEPPTGPFPEGSSEPTKAWKSPPLLATFPVACLSVGTSQRLECFETLTPFLAKALRTFLAQKGGPLLKTRRLQAGGTSTQARRTHHRLGEDLQTRLGEEVEQRQLLLLLKLRLHRSEVRAGHLHQGLGEALEGERSKPR